MDYRNFENGEFYRDSMGKIIQIIKAGIPNAKFEFIKSPKYQIKNDINNTTINNNGDAYHHVKDNTYEFSVDSEYAHALEKITKAEALPEREFKVGEYYRDPMGKIIEIMEVDKCGTFFRFVISPDMHFYAYETYPAIGEFTNMIARSYGYADVLEKLTDKEVHHLKEILDALVPICYSKNMKNYISAPEIPDSLFKEYNLYTGEWNHKIYGTRNKYHIYVNNEKRMIDNVCAGILKKYLNDYEYYERRLQYAERARKEGSQKND